jgi:hypothetical protein
VFRSVRVPARRLRRGEDAEGLQASVERFLSDEANVWPVGGFFFGVVLLLILLAGAKRRAAPPPRAAAAGQGAGGGRVPLGEVLIFLALLYGCVYIIRPRSSITWQLRRTAGILQRHNLSSIVQGMRN